MSEPDYIAYFENLARNHRAIGHGDDRKAFYVVDDDNLSELENALRNELSLPALLLDQYFDEDDTESDNNRLKILGGFSIICPCEIGNVQSIREARATARQIARSIKSRLRKDSFYGGALYEQQIMVSFSMQGEKTPVIGGGLATGWGYSFELLMPDQLAIDPSDWLDL